MTAPLVALHGVALHAGGDARLRRLMSGLEMAVHAGERWAVLGPNGAGKSTLLAAIAGLLRVQAGRIDWLGAPSSGQDDVKLAALRAWSPSFWIDPFPCRVDETVRLARPRIAWGPRTEASDDPEALAALLRRLDVAHLAAHDVRTLSGGERQRVAIAAALWQGAPLLLLDEPASHLDLSHQQLLIRRLREHAEARGGVVASVHDLNLAWSVATHAVLLDGRGGAVAGPRDDVMTPSRLQSAFGVAIDRVEVCGTQRFWIGEGPWTA